MNDSHSSETDSSDSESKSCNGRLTMSALDSSHQQKESTSSRHPFRSEREMSYRYVEENGSLSESHRRLSRSQPSLANATVASAECYESAQERLHSLLDSYRSPHHERERQDSSKPVYRVKFKPPVPRSRSERVTCMPTSSQGSEPPNEDGDGLPSSRPTTPSYQSPTVGLGPHEWQNCPRRSPKRVRSRSLPNSPAPPRAKVPKQTHFRQRATTVPNQIPLDRLDTVHLECGNPELTPRGHLQHSSAPDP